MDDRYSRQILFKPIGEEGQSKLSLATVTIVGCGALGTTIAETLVRAGVGRIILVDRDIVERSNLQRQQLFTDQDAQQSVPKVVAAKTRLLDIRPDADIKTYLAHADGSLLVTLAKESDLIMDATDNFETRFAINDVSHHVGIPWIYGACVGSTSVVLPIVPNETPCFRCLIDSIPMSVGTCDTNGIISPASQITATKQCAEALKWLTGHKEKMLSKLSIEDLWENERHHIGISKIRNSKCKTCGDNPVYPSLNESKFNVSVLCGRNTLQIIPSKERNCSIEEIEKVVIDKNLKYKLTPFFIQFFANDYRVMAFNNGRLLIHGTEDENVGRKIYHQLFG